jgi:hypothetical protein
MRSSDCSVATGARLKPAAESLKRTSPGMSAGRPGWLVGVRRQYASDIKPALKVRLQVRIAELTLQRWRMPLHKGAMAMVA